MTKWYQKASVQSALVGGSFLLAGVLITNIFGVIRDAPPDTVSERESAENQVRSLRDQANWLKGIYEGVPMEVPPSDEGVVLLREKAPPIAEQLLEIEDSNLTEGYRVIKYCYAGMILVLVGQVEPVAKIAGRHGVNAAAALSECERQIDVIQTQANGSSETHSALLAWVDRYGYKDWMRYNQVLALAIRTKTVDQIKWPLLEEALDRVSPVYLERFPLRNNPTLTWICNNLAGQVASHHCEGA